MFQTNSFLLSMKRIKNMNIIIAGDIFINEKLKKKAFIDNSVLGLFSSADYRIVNLEAPLTANVPKNKIIKTGPHLCSTAETMIPYLKELQIDLVTLANNHIFDYGVTGLEDTLQTCKQYNIHTVGAGLTIKHARATSYRKINGRTLAVVNFAENEWCNATDERGGANPYDLIENSRQIRQARDSADVVLVIIHGGHELYHYPSPRMVKHYRYFAEQGATAVIGHHTHCVSGYEIHQNVPIFYSLGNLLFDSTTSFSGWYQGVLLEIKIDAHGQPAWKLIPYSQTKPQQGICIIDKVESQGIFQRINEINKVIACPAQLMARWQSFTASKQQYYLSSVTIPWYFLRCILEKLQLSGRFYSKKQLKLVHNLVRCEAHRDLLLASLENQKK